MVFHVELFLLLLLCLALVACFFFGCFFFFFMLFVKWQSKKVKKKEKKKRGRKKKLIFLDAWGNSLIPDKLPRKALKWLSLPQRQGCKNWKGFHFWLFQLLQKEIFSGVWPLKTVAEQIKITKIPVCERHRVLLGQGVRWVCRDRSG